MIIKRNIGEKGQVVIPKDIREMLNLRKGEKVVFELRDKEAVIRSEENPEEFLRDFLDVPKMKKRVSPEKLKKIYEERYD